MTYNNRPHTGPPNTPERPPWLLFLFLAAVLFLSYHDLLYAKRVLDDSSIDDNIARIGEGSLVHRIALLSLGIGAIVSLVRYQANRRLRIAGPLGWLVLGFVVWAFISPIWAADLPLTVQKLVPFGVLCIAAVAVARRLSVHEIILWTFFSTGLFLLIGIFAEVLFGTFRPFASDYRFAGSLHPNAQGVECGLLLLSAVAAANAERRWRALCWACAFLGFVFLILTRSRTAIAAAVLSLVVYLVAVGSRRLKIALVGGSFNTTCCLFLLLVIGGLLPGLNSAIQLGRNDAGDADTFTGRTMIWEDVGHYIHLRPILGYGYCGFWTPTHINAIWGEVTSSHSAYIEYLLTLGIVGLVASTRFNSLPAFGVPFVFIDFRRTPVSFFVVLCVWRIGRVSRRWHGRGIAPNVPLYGRTSSVGLCVPPQQTLWVDSGLGSRPNV